MFKVSVRVGEIGELSCTLVDEVVIFGHDGDEKKTSENDKCKVDKDG